MITEELGSDKRLDAIWNVVDGLCHLGMFGTIDDLLLDPKTWYDNPDEMLGWAVATLPVKSKLRNRGDFMKRIRSSFFELNKNLEELNGLE